MQTVFFVAFPYIAVILAVGVGIYRYFSSRHSYSSLSSQLLENRRLFWGSVPWQYGITLILLAHLLAWLFPGAAALLLDNPIRLAVLELTGLALGFYTVFGIVVLIARRLPANARARVVTSPMDWVMLFFLLLQVLSGVGVALFERWGSRWYLDTAVPWLWSFWRLQPDASPVVGLPALIQFHILCGFVVVLLFPFTRLVHIFAVPLEYLWRPYQVVIWNRDPRRRHYAALQAESTSAPAPLPPEPTDPERRQLLTRLGILVGSISAAIVAVPSVGFLLGLRRVPETWRSLGAVDSFPVGQTVEVAFLDPSPLPWSGVTAKTAAWLRRVSEQQFLAFSINCTHLGCPVRWLPNADLFMCPCHGGVFYNDGRPAAGPPPRQLSRYPVRVRDGEVQIMTSPLPT